jgi:hypothetical protein
VQAGNSNSSDRDRRLAKQQEMITRLVTWLREEGIEPEERTHLHGGARYFAAIRYKKGAIHILFPKDNLDSITLTEIIGLDDETKKSYESLAATHDGILKQNSFYFDLKLSLLQLNVFFTLRKNMRQLESLDVEKDVYFDGLTKDTLFNSMLSVHNAIEIAKTKLDQFRDVVLPSKAGRTDDSKDMR